MAAGAKCVSIPVKVKKSRSLEVRLPVCFLPEHHLYSFVSFLPFHRLSTYVAVFGAPSLLPAHPVVPCGPADALCLTQQSSLCCLLSGQVRAGLRWHFAAGH